MASSILEYMASSDLKVRFWKSDSDPSVDNWNAVVYSGGVDDAAILEAVGDGPAPSSPRLSGSTNKQQVAKVSYTHDAMIDLIIANPAIKQIQLAEHFGYRPHTISIIINSDAFQEALAKRRDEVVSPELRATIQDRFRAMVAASQEYLLEKLSTSPTPQLALGVLNSASRSLGYGAREHPTVQVNNYVVELPPAARTSEEWAKGRTIDGDSHAIPSEAT